MLLTQVMLGLLYYDILSTFRGFKSIYGTIRRWEVGDSHAEKSTIDQVCAAVNYACIWYPKQALCLQRSFVTTYLLRRRGVPAKLVLGAQRLPFNAHAWVEVDGRVINEGSHVQATHDVWDRC